MFKAINTSLPDLEESVQNDLSRDQWLLYKYTKAIATGSVDDNLKHQIAGPLNHSRWLTLAIRLLQLYTRTENPSDALVNIVTYIVKVYSPSWFKIKSKGKFTSSPSNLFYQMRLVMNLPTYIQELVKPTIQRNAYFSHPDILLCSMLESDLEEVRLKAINLIKKFRKNPPKPPKNKHLKGIRKHVIPNLNWNAKNWWDMIDWRKIKIVEPKIIQQLSTEELEDIIHTPKLFPHFPCHTQSVERAVKLVTEAAAKVEGEDRRHGEILATVESRKSRKNLNSKKKYKY